MLFAYECMVIGYYCVQPSGKVEPSESAERTAEVVSAETATGPSTSDASMALEAEEALQTAAAGKPNLFYHYHRLYICLLLNCQKASAFVCSVASLYAGVIQKVGYKLCSVLGDGCSFGHICTMLGICAFGALFAMLLVRIAFSFLSDYLSV